MAAIGLLPAGPTRSLTADFDGGGGAETARVTVSGAATDLEIADASGRTVAREPLSVPPSAAGAIAFSAGALGSAGTLLEVEYPSAQGVRCRSVWRFREGRLMRLPVRGPGGILPECVGADWTYRWQRLDPKAPSLYVRERAFATPEGTARDVEAYAFSGFELTFAPDRSHRDIRGVAIPDWPDAVFYPRALLEETLSSRYGLSRLRSAPQVRLVTSQADWKFELRVEYTSGRTRTFPVCAATRGPAEEELHLTAEADGQTAYVTVALSGWEEMLPVEALVVGLGTPMDDFYLPVLGRESGALRIYPSAEDEIAVRALPGRWSNARGDAIEVTFVSGFPALLRVGGREVSLSIAGAPEGVDLLLVPYDGSPATAGVTLLGPDRIARVPLVCDASRSCRVAGTPQAFRRTGARLN